MATMTDAETTSMVDLEEAAAEMVPRLRALSRQMELDRHLDDKLVHDMDQAGLFSVVVPKKWGGAGLGAHELNRVVEIIAHGDVSAAWVAGFYNLHNWFLCRFPRSVQEELYADNHSVRAAAIFGPPGSAEPVAGGYTVTGRWGYATGIVHASTALVPALVDGKLNWCIVEKDQLQVLDDWDVAGMSATGSVTVVGEDLFVPNERMLDLSLLMSADQHGGTFHEEEVYRFPFSALTFATASLYVGALDAAVELTRESLQKSSGPGGTPRIDRPVMRINWVTAYQTARIMHRVRDAATDEAIALARRGVPPSLEDEARAQLDIMALRHTVKDTLRSLVDANGSSGYRQSDPLRRMSNDVAMISTHALNGEYDVAMDRHARWLLGLGLAPGDPGARLT